MKVAILTSPNQWFINYIHLVKSELGKSDVYLNHHDIDKAYDIIFVISYHSKIEDDFIKKNKHNIVIHESALPKGRGWAPLFWQILEGKKEITFSLIEMSCKLDAGNIYFQQVLTLSGFELNSEIRMKQAHLTIEMCRRFLELYPNLPATKEQIGEPTFYPKRKPSDSELSIHKSIFEQFNLLRIVDNENYPAFFILDGRKYSIKIYRDE
tara:strand:- start:334 stop:963 length:630 start_codon:yes stop_codon:yes gene_type:complete